MSTKKEIWRLLEPGVDVWHDGDEIQNPVVKWERVPHSWINWEVKKDGQIGRRRMTLPEPQRIEYGWQEVTPDSPTAEDANDQGDVLWLRKGTMGKVAANWSSITYRSESSYWMMLPNDPPKDPDEKAWEKFTSKCKIQHREELTPFKQAFMAGRKSVATEKEDSHG